VRTLRRKILLLVLVLGTAAAAATGITLKRAPKQELPPIEQPIGFNHATHVKEKLGCTDCHTGAATAQHAGFPTSKSCAQCHKVGKLGKAAKSGVEIPWVIVNRTAGHVYFSHRAHVTFGKIKCEECHGNIKDLEEPPPRPMPEFRSMDACIDCHKERTASLECFACHK
jgi:menaquinone reductase, multiheme cytochrome c subunit